MSIDQKSNQTLCIQSQEWLERYCQSIDGSEMALLNGGVVNASCYGRINKNTP